MAINFEGVPNKQRLPYSEISRRIDVVGFFFEHILSHGPLFLSEELLFFASCPQIIPHRANRASTLGLYLVSLTEASNLKTVLDPRLLRVLPDIYNSAQQLFFSK